MRKLPILFAALSVTACTQRETIVIDGCQYIKTTVVSEGVTETLVHKGNCTNPVLRVNTDTARAFIPVDISGLSDTHEITTLKSDT